MEDEFASSLNGRLGINMCLLGRVHMEGETDVVVKKKKKHNKNLPHHRKSRESTLSDSFWDEARRYMRYATATYGPTMIDAAEVDARGRFDPRLGRVAKEAISRHISVPEEDIVVMDLNYDGNCEYLRHMVAVDHKNKKVVLAIRGTFSLDEIMMDVAAFSREFCGGEAHSEMATMAEKVWDVAGTTVKTMLEKNDGYEFIVTGHSLGAGAACLLTILVETKKLLPTQQKVRCFAYAAPPVFTPLEFIPKVVQATTCFVHQNDAVPSLSVNSVRHLLQELSAVDNESQAMSRRERLKVILGIDSPPKELVASVLEADGRTVEPKAGAPALLIPAEKIVWLKQDRNGDDDSYHPEILTPVDMMRRGIRVNPEMLTDHFPPRYEHAFDHLDDE